MTLWGHIRRLFGLRPREVWRPAANKPKSSGTITRRRYCSCGMWMMKESMASDSGVLHRWPPDDCVDEEKLLDAAQRLASEHVRGPSIE